MIVKDLIGMFTPNTKFEMITHWVVEYTNTSFDEEIVTIGTVANFPVGNMYLMYYDFTECWIENDTLYISQEVVQEVDEPLECESFVRDISCKYYICNANGTHEVSENEFDFAKSELLQQGYIVYPERCENTDDVIEYWAEKTDTETLLTGDSFQFGYIQTVYD